MSAAAPQTRQIQKVYAEWCVKAAEIILNSRIDGKGVADKSPETASFNLKVPELFGVRSEAVAFPDFFQLKTQRSFQIEIFAGPAVEQGSEEDPGQLIERWLFNFYPAGLENSTSAPDRCNQTLVRKLSVTLRSLLCFTRLLPAYAFCNAQGAVERHWRCQERGSPDSRHSLEELVAQDFTSVQSSVGMLRLSVAQRRDPRPVANQRTLSVVAAAGFDEAQGRGLEVEEGYVSPRSGSPSPENAALGAAASAAQGAAGTTQTGQPPLPAVSPRYGTALGKIAEEPEVKVSSTLPRASSLSASVNHTPTSTAPSSMFGDEPIGGTRSDRPNRQHAKSDTSDDTMSTSSHGHGGGGMSEHTVVLGSTPPLASLLGHEAVPPAGLVGLHQQLSSACSSTCASRSATPQGTPKQKPHPDPVIDQQGSLRGISPLVAGTHGRASTSPVLSQPSPSGRLSRRNTKKYSDAKRQPAYHQSTRSEHSESTKHYSA